MRILDLYCCQGGASEGYRRAGFDAYGIDLEPQPHYPFAFHRGDVLDILRRLLDGKSIDFARPDGRTERLGLPDFDAMHASPPCRARTRAQKLQGNTHPNLIAPTRELLRLTGLPYIIENVVATTDDDPDPLVDPTLLCGAMFGLRTYRHRLFETGPSWQPIAPHHPPHVAKNAKMGRPVGEGEFMHVVGNFSGVDLAREIMGMPWATQQGLREAIPPAYAEFLGRQLVEHIRA